MADRRARRARSARCAPDQHFLRSRRLAGALVADARVRATDLVVEIGGGTGRLTEPLTERAGHVQTIELDPVLAQRLRARFARSPKVTVIEGDALMVALPAEPFRVVGNLPFGSTSAILRRLLDDVALPLERCDLVVEWGAGRKRAQPWPSTMLNVCWGARYEFAITRRLPAACFEPRPSVDAAVLRVLRRPEPLVRELDGSAFRRLVTIGFRSGVRRATWPLPARSFKRLARELGFAPSAAARDLDVHQWVALYEAIRAMR